MASGKQLPVEADLPETVKRATITANGVSELWTVWGAYALFTIALLLAAFNRGALGLKPGELMLLLFAGALAARRVLRRDWSFPTTAIDAGFLLIILAGTLLPLATMQVRGTYITRDDLRGLLGPVQYYLWYRVMLEALPLPRALPAMSKLILIVISGISFVGDLQIFKFPGVLNFLIKYYPTYETLQSAGFHRATSLVGGWEVLAALAAYALIMINQVQSDGATLRAFGPGWNRWLYVMLAINAVALVAALSVAGFLALAAGYALAWLLNRKLARTTLVALGVGALAALALAPSLVQRYHLQFGGATGSRSLIPQTWIERYQHWQIVITTVFVDLPTVFFGVRPSFTYPVSEFGSTESLYLLFLYRGGIVYVLAFLVFLVLVLRTLWRARALASGPSRSLLTAGFILLSVTFLLGIVDAHFVDAGESQLLLTWIALGSGAILRTEHVVARPIFGGLAPRLRSTAYAALAVGLVASLGLAGVAYRANKRLAPPPTPLAFGTPFDGLASAWRENQRIGSAQWQLSTTNTTTLQGYAGGYSVEPGATLPLAISAASSMAVDLSVYRLGWYYGSGGRLYATAHVDTAPRQGIYDLNTGRLTGCDRCQIDPLTHAIDAHWQTSYQLAIGADWPSGVYLVKLSGNGTQSQAYIPFIVRAPASGNSPVLAVLPFMTYAAENLWGGADLTTTSPADRYLDVTRPNRATQISFDRPFVDSAGAGELLNFDLHSVRWLERAGFNVTYVTDLDLAQHPEWLTQHRAVVFTGRSAYWPLTLRDGLEAARAKGTHLLFFGAQNGYWQARLAPDAAGQADRMLVCYKVQSTPTGDATQALTNDPLAKSQPKLVTARWRDPALNRPESALLGAMYGGSLAVGDASQNGVAAIGSAHPAWVASFNSPLDPIAQINTGLTPGKAINGWALSYGYDTLIPQAPVPAGVVILGASSIPNPRAGDQPIAHTVYYRYGPGPIVFDAGSIAWPMALDEFTFPGADIPNGQLGQQALATLTANILFTALPPA